MTQAAMEAFQAAGRDMVPMTGEANNGFLRCWIDVLDEGFSSVAPSSAYLPERDSIGYCNFGIAG